MAKTPAGDVPEEVRIIQSHLTGRLNPMKEAELYAKLLRDRAARSQRDLARLVGVSQARVSQRMALLTMPKKVRKLMAEAGSPITERHARELRSLKDPKLVLWVAKKIVAHRLTVDQTQEVVQSMTDELGTTTKKSGWQVGMGCRWREHSDMLEVQVHAHGLRSQLRDLSKLVPFIREEARQRGRSR